MDLHLLFPPALVKRALDDLSAIAGAAQRLPGLEQQVLGRVDRIREEALARADALQAELVRVREGVAALQAELEPILELPAVRAAVRPLPDKLDAVNAGLGTLQEEMAPIQELPGLRAAVEPLAGKLDALHQDVAPHLAAVRQGIEPLDEDMRAVRGSIDDIEPLLRQVLTRLGALDKRVDALQSSVRPLGEIADRIPGVG